MYCPKCGAVVELQTKFCKSCGLRLVDHAQLLDGPDDDRDGENRKQIRKGTKFLLASLIAMTLNFVMTGGLLIGANPSFPITARIFMVIVLLATPLLIGGIGVGYLVRGGFFKKFREQQIAEEIEKLEQKRKKLDAKRGLKLNPQAITVEAVSVTESTTRELKLIVVETGKIEGR